MGAETSSLNGNNNTNNGNNMSQIEREQMEKMQRHMLAKQQAEAQRRSRTQGGGRTRGHNNYSNNVSGKVRQVHSREHSRVMNEARHTQNRINDFVFSNNEVRNMVGKEQRYDRLNVASRKPVYTERMQPVLQHNNPEKQGYKKTDYRAHKNAEIARSVNNMTDFEAQERKLEEKYKRDERRRRKQFETEKQQRRKKFVGELERFKTKFDPYKILSLPKNYTLSQLKRSYKKMAMKTHPDKGGDPRVFKVITKSYMYLLDELNKRESNHNHNDMRSGAEKYMSGQSTEAPITLNDDGGNFNINKFNKLYSEHRMEAPEDVGYGDWMNSTMPGESSKKPLFSKGFNLDVFNSVFNDERDTTSSSVVKYTKPSALVSSSGVACVELGRGQIEDFSSDGTTVIAGRGTKRQLQFTDYKIAHTKTTITGVSSDRRDFNSIGDLKMDRKNISYTMSAEDAEREARMKREGEERERLRRERLANHDRLAAQHFSRVRNVITGKPPDPNEILSITNGSQYR